MMKQSTLLQHTPSSINFAMRRQRRGNDAAETWDEGEEEAGKK